MGETPSERPGSAARLLLGGTRSKEETLEDILIFQVSPTLLFSGESVSARRLTVWGDDLVGLHIGVRLMGGKWWCGVVESRGLG